MAVFNKPRVGALTAELLGTGLLAMVVLTVSQITGGIGYYVSFAVGTVIAMLILIFGAASGGHFNPAITLGLWTVRKVSTLRAATYVGVQLLGGYLAYLLFTYLIGQELTVTAVDFDAKILVAEVVGTAVLAFGVAAAVFQRFTTGAAAATVGLAITVGILLATTASSGFLNPAVALGAQSFELATYVLGPVLGAILGINLYSLLFSVSEKPSLKAKAAAVKPVVEETVEIVEEVVITAPVKKPAAKKTPAKAAATKKPAAKKAPAKKPATKKSTK